MLNYFLFFLFVQISSTSVITELTGLNVQSLEKKELDQESGSIKELNGEHMFQNNLNFPRNNAGVKIMHKRDLSLPQIPQLPTGSSPELPKIDLAMPTFLPKLSFEFPKIPFFTPLVNSSSNSFDDSASRKKREINHIRRKPKCNLFDYTINQNVDSKELASKTNRPLFNVLFKPRDLSKPFIRIQFHGCNQHKITIKKTTKINTPGVPENNDIIAKFISELKFPENRLESLVPMQKPWDKNDVKSKYNQWNDDCANEVFIEEETDIEIKQFEGLDHETENDVTFSENTDPTDVYEPKDSDIMNELKAGVAKLIKSFSIGKNKKLDKLNEVKRLMSTRIDQVKYDNHNKYEKLKDIAVTLNRLLKRRSTDDKNLNSTDNADHESKFRNRRDTKFIDEQSEEMIEDYDETNMGGMPSTLVDTDKLNLMKNIITYDDQGGNEPEGEREKVLESIHKRFQNHEESEVQDDNNYFHINYKEFGQYLNPLIKHYDLDEIINQNQLGLNENNKEDPTDWLSKNVTDESERKKRSLDEEQNSNEIPDEVVETGIAVFETEVEKVTKPDKKTKNKRDEDDSEEVTTTTEAPTTTTIKPTTTTKDYYEEITTVDYYDVDESCPTDIIMIILNALKCLLNLVTSALFGIEFGSSCCR